MTQTTLINTQTMASTKAVLAAQHARTRAESLSGLTPTTESKLTVPSAASAVTQRINSPSRSLPRTEETEFNLPDEDRVLAVLWSERYCDSCGCKPVVIRVEGKFRVCCSKWEVTRSFGHTKSGWCPEPTPWFKSSAAAIRHWKL